MSRIERVRCLGCGTTYAKPVAGGTVSSNPGCPRCGYVGWVLAVIPSASEPSRFAEGRLRRLHVQPR